MNSDFYIVTYAVSLLFGMLILLEVGRRIGLRHMLQSVEGSSEGFGAVEGALLALLGLLIAFTFSSAAQRFDARRQLIIDESNSIGTAYLRVDLLPADVQPRMRDLFRQYVDARLEVYRDPHDAESVRSGIEHSQALQNEIWALAVSSSNDSQPTRMLLLPSLNQMFDIATTRLAATQMHPPLIIFVMLGVLVLINALLAGYGMAAGKVRSWIHIIGFAVILAFTVYVILDIEYPSSVFSVWIRLIRC